MGYRAFPLDPRWCDFEPSKRVPVETIDQLKEKLTDLGRRIGAARTKHNLPPEAPLPNPTLQI